MKKIIALLLVLTLAITAFAGCAKPKTELKGTTAEILAEINKNVTTEIKVEDKNVFENGLPTYGFTDGKKDLTEEEFKKLVVEGDYTQNMISSMYHHVIVLKFANNSDAIAYKEAIAKKIQEFPYVCGMPESYYVNDSENFVFIAVTFSDYVEKFAKSFEKLAVNFGKSISGNI